MHEPATIAEREAEIIDDFSFLENWTDKYGYLIEIGKALPPLDERYKTEAHKVHGCQAQVWLHSELEGGRVTYEADSDALITKGLIALLIRVLGHQRPEDITAARLGFIDQIGMREHLSANRSNGLNAMVKRMKYEAMTLSNGLKSETNHE